MGKSLQEKIDFYIDFYIGKGYNGEKLHKVLLKNKDYVKLLHERKQKLTKKISLTKSEAKNYVLSRDEDYTILEKVKLLEKKRLTKEERFLLKLIRTQLEHDWRKRLIKELDKILLRYKRLSRS